jgi:hypothetical protein
MRVKFQPGVRVQANDKAPGDYRGHVGTVLQHKPSTSEYQVQFDGDERGPGWLESWRLEPLAPGA